MSDASDAHDLIPLSLQSELPPLYTPDSSFTWCVVEYDPAERLCFGLVIGHEREMGYFSIEELEQVRGPLGLRIKRDLYFEPRLLSKLA